MYVNYIKLKNYMSFEKVDLQLEPSKLYLLTGENLDVGGKNGIGKSALIESIVFSIYGKNVRVGSKDVKELITNGKRELKTKIKLCDYIIERERTKTKSHVKLFKYHERKKVEDLTKRTNTETDNFINYILLPFDKFMYVNYFNPQSLVFFSLTPKQKFQIIESLLNLDVINELLEQYKEQQKSISEELQKLSTEKVKYQTSIDMLEKQIADIQLNISDIQYKLNNQHELDNQFENRIKQEFTKTVNQIKDTYEKYISNISKSKEELETIEVKLKEYQDISNINESEISSKLLTIKSQLTLYQQLKSTIEKAKQKGICPTCKQPYLINEDEFIKEQTKGDIKSYSELLEIISKLNRECENLEKLQKRISEYNRYKQQYELHKQVIEEQQKQLQQYLDNIKQNYPEHYSFIFDYNNSALYSYIENKKQEYRKQSGVQFLEDTLNKLESQLENTKKQLADYKSKLQSIENKLYEIEKLQEKVTILINELSHNGEFRQTIISNYLKELEHSLNVMIKQLNPQFKITLTIEQSGKNKGINVVISDNGITKSYGQLSTGERRMVDMSLLLTFSSFSSGFLLIDEALDSLSYENQLKVIHLLEKLNKQILLVTHNQQLIEEIFDSECKDRTRLLWIEKKNGVSKVIVK